ncbi:hypothetical protein [Streptomyces sp. NPDC001135]
MTGDRRGLELRIGEIAVRGVELRRPDLLGPAFEAALTRRLRERGVPPGWTTGEVSPPSRPLTLTVAPGAGAEEIAEGLARTVYAGLGG